MTTRGRSRRADLCRMPLFVRGASTAVLLLAIVQLCGAAAWFSRPRGESGSGVQLANRKLEPDIPTAALADRVRPFVVPQQLWQQCRGPRRSGSSDTSAAVSADVRSPLRRPWRSRCAVDEVQLVEVAPVPSDKPPAPRGRKKRVLMLICDTGGGHRASALALEASVRIHMRREEIVDFT